MKAPTTSASPRPVHGNCPQGTPRRAKYVLYHAGYHALDLSGAVPRLRSRYYERVPSVWPADSVRRLLGVIDRGNPTGKRDYAIMLLAARLGMRVGDIKALTLSALHWENKTIVLVQQKNRQAMTYPLLDDIGWALIDYLQHGRPQTSSPHVFVRHNAPFEAFAQFANFHHLMTTYTRRAGIPLPRGAHGMHSLRHTLASALLEQHTPLPVIAEIMGHLSLHSAVSGINISWFRFGAKEIVRGLTPAKRVRSVGAGAGTQRRDALIA